MARSVSMRSSPMRHMAAASARTTRAMVFSAKARPASVRFRFLARLPPGAGVSTSSPCSTMLRTAELRVCLGRHHSAHICTCVSGAALLYSAYRIQNAVSDRPNCTAALIDALRQRKFAGVGLDVYETEDNQIFEDYSDDVLRSVVVPVLLSFPNVVITSHQAFFTRTALQSIAITTMENARAFAKGEKLVNLVE